ncbi:MAG TPA: MATE family efflux transporter [Prolixibacteraceae bacterium]|nr:MATE family efflux transporter [Prolixibacteraceae bacterium]
MNAIRRYFSGYNEPGGIKELLILSLPMIISTACDGVMTFTDRLFLARVGSEQMNAALGGGVAMQMLTFFFIGLTGYSTALVAQYFGAGEKQNTTKSAFQAVLIALLAWPLIMLSKPVLSMYFEMARIPASQLGYQNDYLNILIWGSVFSLLRHTLGCYFTGIGKTKIVMTATVLAMIINVILDYILIFGKLGFEPMGVKGAALATISGSFLATLLLFIVYLNKTNQVEFSVLKSFRFNWPIMKKLIVFGSPAGFELFLNFIAFSIMISIFHSKGDVAATATTIMFNWDMVSYIPLLGLEIAVTSLVGRYMGARKPEIAQHAALSAIKIGIFYSLIVLILFVFIPEALVRVFHPAQPSQIFEDAVPIAVNMIKIAALYVLAESMLVAFVGALRGAGDTFFTMIVSVAAHWTFVPVIYLSLYVFNFSVELSWFLLVVFFLIFGVVLGLRFKSGKWKKIKVINN